MDYRAIDISEIPFEEGGVATFELFVKMPSTGDMAVFVQKDERISAQRWENLSSLSSAKNLFVRADLVIPRKPTAAKPVVAAAPPPRAIAPAFERDAMKPEAEVALKDSFRKMIQPAGASPAESQKVSALIGKMADEIYATLVPEVGPLRASLMANLKNMQRMNDAAAMSALAVLVAVSNDFKSKTALQNLCLAALLMDAALAELTPSELETYYRARTELPAHIQDKVRNHPLKSQQMVAYLPQVNDTINQLILMHHELNNGNGYHRGIRTANSAALVRVIALAVDIYEYIRGAELNGGRMTINDALTILKEPGIEAHQRRHAAKLVDNVVAYLA